MKSIFKIAKTRTSRSKQNQNLVNKAKLLAKFFSHNDFKLHKTTKKFSFTAKTKFTNFNREKEPLIQKINSAFTVTETSRNPQTQILYSRNKTRIKLFAQGKH